MVEPLVSVVIPFYSGKKWLEEAIKSVQTQTYKNIEIIVINDGSSENIDDLFGKRNVKIISKENGGPASARNLGIEKAVGKYIAFLDSDDIWLPSKLTKQIFEMEANNYYWSHHSYEMFWEGKNKKEVVNTRTIKGNVYKDCFISFKVQTSCVVVLKSILVENKITFPNKRFGQDLEFYKQIARLYPIAYIEGVYSRFRIRGNNAGFRAWVQINNKASVWKDIENNKVILNILPRPIIFAYKICFLLSKILNSTKKILSEQGLEYFSKIIYLFPYILFKGYSRRSR